MADYTVEEIDDLEAVNGVFRRARDELGISSFGINCLDLPADWDGYPAHAEPEQEEVYLPLSGTGEIELEGQRVLVVTHGGALDAVYRHATRMPLSAFRDFPIYNASVNVVTYDDGHWRIESWGDIRHLPQELAMDDS